LKCIFRLAKEYISQLKATRDGDVDDEIRDDALEAAGKLFKPSAEHIQQAFDKKQIETRFCKNGHSKTPTGTFLSRREFVFVCLPEKVLEHVSQM